MHKYCRCFVLALLISLLLLLLLLPAAHKGSLPPLNQQHELKLKQLTVASLALQQKVGPWWDGVGACTCV
jgi:hypothetical protein